MPIASPFAALVLGAAVAVAPAPEPLLHLRDPALVESSGLAASMRHDGLLWTHADGGTTAQVRAVDGSGSTVAVVTLRGIDPYDPEALAPSLDRDGTPRLWLGDIGDNAEERDDISVFSFDEPPVVGDQTVAAEWFRLRYPDGPHDAEALLVHPRTGTLFVVTKALGTAGVYRAPRQLVAASAGVNELERVADAPLLVTDGAFLPDGRVLLRTYTSVFLLDRSWRQLATEELPAQPQGESLAVDGDRVLVGSEGEGSAVYAVPIPAAAERPVPRAEESPRDPSGVGEPRASRQRLVGGLVVAAVALALLTVVRAWARRGRARLPV